jgi:hypothetical protein
MKNLIFISLVLMGYNVGAMNQLKQAEESVHDIDAKKHVDSIFYFVMTQPISIEVDDVLFETAAFICESSVISSPVKIECIYDLLRAARSSSRLRGMNILFALHKYVETFPDHISINDISTFSTISGADELQKQRLQEFVSDVGRLKKRIKPID